MAVPTTTVNQYSDNVGDTTRTSFPILAANGGVFTGNLITNLAGTGDVSDYFIVDILGGSHDTGAGSLGTGTTGGITLNVQSNDGSHPLGIDYQVLSYATLNASGIPAILGGTRAVTGNGSVTIPSNGNWAGTTDDVALVFPVYSYPSDFSGNYTITLSNGTTPGGGNPGGPGGGSTNDLTVNLLDINTNTGFGSVSTTTVPGGSVNLHYTLNNTFATPKAPHFQFYLTTDPTITTADTPNPDAPVLKVFGAFDPRVSVDVDVTMTKHARGKHRKRD
jgi:hypothetical protein